MRDGTNLAMALSPLDPLLYAMKASQAMSFIGEERYEEAAEWAQGGVRSPGSHYLLGMICAASLHLNGDAERARYWVENTKSRRPDASIERFFEAFPYKSGERRERMERALREAGF